MPDKYFDGLGSFAMFCYEEAISYAEKVNVAAEVSSHILQTTIKDGFGKSPPLMGISDTTASLRDDGGAGGPLSDTGRMEDSIERTYEPLRPGEAISGAGSSDFRLLKQEHGYVTAPSSMIPNKIVPPRPVFAIGAYKAIPKVIELAKSLLAPGHLMSFASTDAMLSNAGDIANAIEE